jgi:hypothetical protein
MVWKGSDRAVGLALAVGRGGRRAMQLTAVAEPGIAGKCRSRRPAIGLISLRGDLAFPQMAFSGLRRNGTAVSFQLVAAGGSMMR